MARLHFVKKARKARKDIGVKKGESYYWTSMMMGGRGVKRHWKEKPPRSALTNSAFWGAIYDLQDGFEEPADAPDLQQQRDDVVSQLEAIRDETQEKYDNLPEGFQNGSSGELLQERVASVEDAISEVEAVDCDFEPDDDLKEDKLKEAENEFVGQAWSEIEDAINNISCS